MPTTRFKHTSESVKTDVQVIIANYAQLHTIAWNRPEHATCSEAEALALFERNWRFVDQSSLSPAEKAFIDHLVVTHGNGVLHV